MTAGAIVTSGGAFSATTEQSSRINPFVDPGPWGKVIIGGLTLPGIVKSIDGAERPEEWLIQKAISVSGAVAVWRGTQLAESIKILLELPKRAAFDGYYDVRDTLRPKIGKKPPAHSIVNAGINFSGITRVSCRNVGMPKWVKQGGYWSGEIDLVQYSPPRTIAAGTVVPPKPTAEDPANVKAEKEFREALDEAHRLGG